MIELTRKEFGVLETLLTAQGAVVSSEELLDRVWDENADPFTTTVRVTMMTLRRKLGEPAIIDYRGRLGLSHRPWRARAVRRGGRIGSVRILRPTLRIRMALLYGGLVLLVGVSLLVLALLLLDRAVGNLGIFANGQGTATITVNGHVVYSGPTQGLVAQARQDARDYLLHTGLIFFVISRRHRRAGRLPAGQAGPAPDRQGHPHGPAAVDRDARPAHQPGWSGRRAARARGHLRRDAGPPRCRLRQPATVRRQRQPRAADPAVGDPHRAGRHAVRPDASSEELRRMGEVVQQATERAQRLVSSLLTLARLQAGVRGELEVREPVDLATLVPSALEGVQREAAQRNITIEQRFRRPAPLATRACSSV